MYSMYRWSTSKTFHPAEQVNEWRLTTVSDEIESGYVQTNTQPHLACRSRAVGTYFAVINADVNWLDGLTFRMEHDPMY